MLPSLVHNVGGYLYMVFVEKMSWALVIGLIGQGMFTARFVVQWLASERAGHSVIPLSFWFLSIVGGLIVLAYALYMKEPVLIIGQSFGTFIYIRNLMFVYRDRRRRAVRPDTTTDVE